VWEEDLKRFELIKSMRGVLFCVFLLGLSFVFASGEIVTREEALVAISNSEDLINEMKENNFSVIRVSGDLVRAKEIFELVDYSEILNDGDATSEARIEAAEALKDVDWDYLDYGDVLEYTDAIDAVGEEAFLSYESLVSARVVYNEYSGESLGLTLLEKAEDAFYNERYDEAEKFVLMAKQEIEAGSLGASFFDWASEGVNKFFVIYWGGAIVFVVLVIGGFCYKRFYERG
jgi:hypothetical protein